MIKIIKNGFLILIVVLEFLFLSYYLLIFSMQSSFVQTKIASWLTTHLGNELKTTVKIERARFDFFNRMVLDNVFVADQSGDTLLYTQEIDAGFNLFQLLKSRVTVNSLCFNRPYINLYKKEGNELFNSAFLINYFSAADNNSNQPELFLKLDHFEILNGKFRLENEISKGGEGFNPDHILLTNLNTYLGDIVLTDSSYEATSSRLSFQSGKLNVENFSAQLYLSSKVIKAHKMSIKTTHSEVLGSVSFHSNSWADYDQFNDHVKFDATFQPSDISMEDLSYFFTDLKGLNDKSRFSGNFNGTLSDLKGNKVILDISNHSHADLDFRISGLPDLEGTYFNLSIRKLVSSKNGIEKLRIPPFEDVNFIKLPSNIAHLGQIYFLGEIEGYHNNLNIDGHLETQIGDMDAIMTIRNDSTFSYKGQISATNFNAGKFFDASKYLGSVSLSANIAGSGLEKENVDAQISGQIHTLGLNSYTYQNVGISGKFRKETFKGKISVRDPNLKLEFSGMIDLSDEEKKFDFQAEITDLNPRLILRLPVADSSARLSTIVSIDIAAKSIDSLVGKLKMTNTCYIDADENIAIEEFEFNSQREKGRKYLTVHSDIFDFDVRGQYDMLDDFKSFRKLVRRYFPNLVPEDVKIDKDFTFNLLIKDFRLIERLVSPDFSLDKGSLLAGEYRSVDDYLDVEAKVFGCKYKNFEIDTSLLHIYTDLDRLNLEGRISHFGLQHQKGARSVELTGLAAGNTMEVNLDFYGAGPISSNLTIITDVIDESSVNFRFSNSSFTLGENIWKISDSNSITYQEKRWNFNEVSIGMGNQIARMNGQYSGNADDEFSVELINFDLDMLNPFLDSTLSIDGILDGEALIKSHELGSTFESDLEFLDLVFNNRKLGSGFLKSTWNDKTKSLESKGKISLTGKELLKIEGQYNTLNETSPLHFEIDIESLPLTVIEPLTKDILSQLEGNGSGNLLISGKLNSPELSGSLSLEDASFLVDYTNVRYKILQCAGKGNIVPVRITTDSIIISSFCAVDEYGNVGHGNVSFIHDQFRKFDVKLSMEAENLLVLNTSIKQNELFYGRGFASGTVKLDVKSVMTYIDLDLILGDKTMFNLPVGTAEVEENRFIVFEKREDEAITKSTSVRTEDLRVDVNLKLKATPVAVVRLVFDEMTGDVIETRGSGDIKIRVDPKKGLSMYGEYEVESGTYMFTLQTIVNKKFSIQRGGWIRWNGNPYDGEMDITTSYKLKTRLYDILPEIDPDYNYRKKVPVELKLKMTESVISPIISFGVHLTDSKESIRSQLNTELSNENCLNQQVFSLLILGAFTPCEAKADNTVNTNVGKNTAYETMSNQLSGWLSKISNDVDVDFSYRPENEGEAYSSEQVEVALSTQLFNDRLIVDGNVGYGNQTGTTQNTKDWAGEFTIEYKIRPDGKLRVKAFNKVNDRSYVENDNLYIQGIGLKFTHDFGSPSTQGNESEKSKDNVRKEDEEEPQVQ